VIFVDFYTFLIGKMCAPTFSAIVFAILSYFGEAFSANDCHTLTFWQIFYFFNKNNKNTKATLKHYLTHKK